jgi:glucose-6-phosphate isomerase
VILGAWSQPLSSIFEPRRAAPQRLAKLIARCAGAGARTDFASAVGPIYANFARQRYDDARSDALFALADGAMPERVPRPVRRQNASTRPKIAPRLHTALRSALAMRPCARPHAKQRSGTRAHARVVDTLQASESPTSSASASADRISGRAGVDALRRRAGPLPRAFPFQRRRRRRAARARRAGSEAHRRMS